MATKVTKVHYRTPNNRLAFEIEGGNPKDIFAGIASVQEVFEAASKCGACGSEYIRFNVRTVTKGPKTYTYYEMKCLKCRARLSFGQSQDTENLFPKRKDENGRPLPNNGWEVYTPKESAA